MPEGKSRHEPSMADQVYDRLLREIVEDKYPLNARLPSEAILSLEVGVSRPVLRTALARLRDDGIVSSRRGSGNYVARRPDKSVLQLVPLGSITDIQRCYEFRVDVEGACAAWAARKRTDSDLVALEAADAEMQKQYQAGKRGVKADLKFHTTIAHATKNPFYISVSESLSSQIEFGMRLSRSLTLQATPGRNTLVRDEHSQIIQAIRAKDPEAAKQAMQHHILAARDRMFDGEE